MWPAETEVHGLPALSHVWQHVIKYCQRLCLGARPRYNLVVDEDVKKPNKQTKQTNKDNIKMDYWNGLWPDGGNTNPCFSSHLENPGTEITWLVYDQNYNLKSSLYLLSFFVFGFLMSSSTTRLYHGWVPRLTSDNFKRGDHDFCLRRSHYTDTDTTSRERVATAGIEHRTSSPGVVRSTDWATTIPYRLRGESVNNCHPSSSKTCEMSCFFNYTEISIQGSRYALNLRSSYWELAIMRYKTNIRKGKNKAKYETSKFSIE